MGRLEYRQLSTMEMRRHEYDNSCSTRISLSVLWRRLQEAIEGFDERQFEDSEIIFKVEADKLIVSLIHR